MADSCCNPFSLPRHNWSSRKKNLRLVSEWMCNKADISMGSKICDSCRKKLAKVPNLDTLPMSPTECGSPTGEQYIDVPAAVASVNSCLLEIGETPLPAAVRSSRRIESKMDRLAVAMKGLILEDSTNVDPKESDESEMILQLKEKFRETTKRSEQVQILTVLPRSWTRKRIQNEFGVSEYMARKSKQLVREKGVLSSPDPKPGHSLPSATLKQVADFYESDEVSRMMPGKKDFVSVRQEGKRIHVQKRLVLSNLKEVYRMFKDAFPGQTIGFSKFAELRPPHCILAGASGTHAVCVCTIHQNVKLMFLGARLSDITAPESISLPTYKHCLAKIICNPPLPTCYLGECSSCPGIAKFKNDLTTLLDENLIDDITFKQWISVDRTTLETYTRPVDEFIDIFCEKLEVLRPHAFIAAQQASFFNECKSALAHGEMVVTVDFSENYSFVLQDAAQGYHWNNSQATIHPFVAYYKDGSDKLCHLSYVVISEALNHDTSAVYLYQKRFIAFLMTFLPSSSQPRKITYFSDGAGSQYKNRKNFLNLCHHKEDFGIAAEWHFSATAHGKEACDGVGGTVKRLAARASLQKPYSEQIMTPRQLFDWASINIPSVHFAYCSLADYEEEVKNLEERFSRTRTIPGTRKLHSFVPVSKDRIEVKPFSTSTTSKEERVSCGDDVPIGSISGFVTCVVDNRWWLACVLQLSEDDDGVRVTLLHPPGPRNSFRYPSNEHIVTVTTKDILSVVDPRTRTGRVYTLTRKEIEAATDKFSRL